MAELPEQPKRKWSNKDHFELLAKIPDSKRSMAATVGARAGGLILSITGGYAANRFGLHGAELLGAAAPGFLLDLRVGLLLRVERIVANKQKRQNEREDPLAIQGEEREPAHVGWKRVGALGAAALNNVIAFGTGAAMAYANQQEAAHDHGGLVAGAVATITGFAAMTLTGVGTEIGIEGVGETFDPPLTMHRELFDDGNTLYRRPRPDNGPSPLS